MQPIRVAVNASDRLFRDAYLVEAIAVSLAANDLDPRHLEIEVTESSAPRFEMFGPQGVEEVGINLKEMLPGIFNRSSKQQVTVAEAREVLEQQETEKLIDRQQVQREARQRVEQAGRIQIIDLSTDTRLAEPFLDIHLRVRSGGERGLLGLAFHPNYAENGFFYEGILTHFEIVKDDEGEVRHMLMYQDGAEEPEKAVLSDEAVAAKRAD